MLGKYADVELSPSVKVSGVLQQFFRHMTRLIGS